MHLTRQNCWWSKKVKKCDLHLATRVSHIPLQFLRFYRKKMCVFPVRLIKHLTVWIYRSDSPVPLFVWLVDWLIEKVLGLHRSCTKWKNVLFGRILSVSASLLFICSDDFTRTVLNPLPSFHLSAWNKAFLWKWFPLQPCWK